MRRRAHPSVADLPWSRLAGYGALVSLLAVAACRAGSETPPERRRSDAKLAATAIAGPTPAAEPAAPPVHKPSHILVPESEVTLAGSRSGVAPRPARGEPALTVESVSVITGGASLSVTVHVREDVAEFLAQHRRVAPLMKLYLDTDNNPATGGQAWSTELARGFEVEVELRPGAIFRTDDGLTVGVGAYPSGGEVEEAIVVADISRQRAGAAAPERVAGGLVIGGVSDEIRDRCLVVGDELTLSIPYSQLGISSADSVRITARRLGVAGGLADQYFPEALLEVS